MAEVIHSDRSEPPGVLPLDTMHPMGSRTQEVQFPFLEHLRSDQKSTRPSSNSLDPHIHGETCPLLVPNLFTNGMTSPGSEAPTKCLCILGSILPPTGKSESAISGCVCMSLQSYQRCPSREDLCRCFSVLLRPAAGGGGC